LKTGRPLPYTELRAVVRAASIREVFMKPRSEFGNAVREATAVLLLPLVAIASSGPAFAQQAKTAPPASAKPPAAKPAAAAPAAGAPAADKFVPDQLEQMVAPVALYPDSLLTQLFMASTFPIQIVQAARWLEKHPGLKEKALEDALKPETWDASVKSICGFPDVLKKMNENLDWTQDMGEAFLAQRSEVLDAVQRMRGKAYESGNLKTTPQQTVTQQQDKIIVIQPSDPEVIYVPQYSSTVVYGSAWAYPSYYYPPAYYGWGYGAMAFTAGFVWGAAMWGGCSWGWGHSDVDIDVNRQNNFNGRTDGNFGNRGEGGRGQGNRGQASPKNGGRQSWNRDSGRGGASNKSSKYGGRGSTGASNNQARGYGSRSGSGASGSRGGASASTRDVGGSFGGASRGGATATPSTRGSGSGSSFGSGSSSRGSGSSSYGGSRGSSGSSAWSGSRGGSSSTRSSSSRGSMSRGGGGGRGGGRR
jgi:hypothetical protein